jgi:5-methylthioadenosine/S-adenosylhomocysteine deaminase
MPEQDAPTQPVLATVDRIVHDATVLTGTTRPAIGYPGLPENDVEARGVATFKEHHSIGVSNGAIEWIVPASDVTPAVREGAEVIDARGRVAIPGLMNSHTHSAMTMFRNSAEDVSTHGWFNRYIWPMESNMTPRDVRLGAQLAVGEMLLAGVTSFADHYFDMPEIARVVEESGARALLAQTFFSSQGEKGIGASAAFAEEWDGAAGGRIRTAMGPHAPYTVSDDDLRRTAEHARRLGVRTHLHSAENPAQTASSLAKRGVTPTQVIHDTGIVEAGVIIAHGGGIIEDDLRWLVPYADRVGVAGCDKVYLKHAQSGVTPVKMLHDAGITVGVGTDGAAGHNTLDVLESLRFLALSEKFVHEDATWLTAAHALDLATRQSAELFGQSDALGTLAPGFRADIVLIDITAPHMQPLHDLAAALVYSVKSSDVVTVLVDGEVLVRDRRLTRLDLDEAITELGRRAAALRDISHGQRIQDYEP